MGELGRFPIMISIIMSVMNYWNHILLNRENKLLQAAYREDVALDKAGKDSYITFIKRCINWLEQVAQIMRPTP